MSLQTHQTAQQRFVLAPQLGVALKILHMTAMELQAFLQQQAEDNPLLDVEELLPAPGPEEASAEEPAEETSEEAPTERRPPPGPTASLSLHESLRLQLGCQPLSDEEHRLGELLIEQINQDGYLEATLPELTEWLGAAADQLERVVRLLQQLDPPGVGARDLRECLLLQVERAGWEGGVLARMLREHFPLVMRKQIAILAKAMGVSRHEVVQASEQLRRLNPKPGRGFGGDTSPLLVPDLLIVKQEQHYDVELNEQLLPRVRLSSTYSRMLRDPETPPEAQAFLTQHVRKAQWLLKAIHERNTTLLAIGRCILSLQWEFIERGMAALKPMTQTQVAQLISRHPSTVSRAIAGKTLATPSGIFALERLFTAALPHLTTPTGISPARIKAELHQLIIEEDPADPVSDEGLARRLATRNLPVARRTVAKYRTALKILPAHLRRHP